MEGVVVEIDRARPLPLDWARWRDSLLGGAPEGPIAEDRTVPEGWPLTLVEVAAGDGLRVHAFYAVLDHAVHAMVTLATAASPLRARVHEMFKQAQPVWPDEIVALVDL